MNDTNRVTYIRKNYTLTQLPGGEWEARAVGCEWSSKARIVGSDRTEVCRQFRAYWGHFNYQDEADAFGAIFR
jgi:hypothetical protein